MAAVAADTTAPTVVGITLSPDSVTVAGLNLVPVTVNVHLTDDSGVELSSGMDLVSTPLVSLTRGSGTSKVTEGVELALTSGTAQDGVWSATIQVPSTWAGEWEAARIVASDAVGNKLDVDPRTLSIQATMRVTGRHQPALTLRFTPDPVLGNGRLTMQGRAYYLDTGAGIPNLDLFIGLDNTCVEGKNAANTVTDSTGRYSKSFSGNNDSLHCVGVLRPSNISISPAYITYQGAFPRVKYLVDAAAERTSLPLGSKVTVKGRVTPTVDGATVQLQRLEQGTWRNVQTSTVTDGRFTMTATPAKAGEHSYRVYVPFKEDDALSGVSRTLTVQITTGGSGGGGLPVTGPALPPLIGTAIVLLAAGLALRFAGSRGPRSRRTPASH